MKWSALSLLVGAEILVWCLAGSVLHGWQVLCYPLAWVAIAGFFWGLNVRYDRRAAMRTVASPVDLVATRRKTIETSSSTGYAALKSRVSAS